MRLCQAVRKLAEAASASKVIIGAGLISLAVVAVPMSPVGAAERTDWFHEAGWGVMTHYLGAPPSSSGGKELTAEMWNRQVDAFNAEGLAEQLASSGAKYLLFTIGQNSGQSDQGKRGRGDFRRAHPERRTDSGAVRLTASRDCRNGEVRPA